MTSVTTPATGPGAWDAALDDAFRLLLGGRPDEDPDAVYGVYYADDGIDEFLFPSVWATPEALTDHEPGELLFPGADGYPFSPAKWRFDFRESLFRFDAELLDLTGAWGEGGHKGPRPFRGDFAADVRAVAIDGADRVLVRGADLGPLLARHGVDLAHESAEQLNGWLTVVLRVATDGTLAHAMRTATFTDRGPDDLAPFGDEGYFDAAEQRWEETLSAVPLPALRDHLRMLCLDQDDARASGAYYCGAEAWPFSTDILDEIGCSLIAGWEFGESQAGTAVVRLPDSPVRSKPAE
ncbi:hypothetical protein [Catenulispora rubra]|uniref:hypothetical protein n=1 Tax=Catenulispora rubra TaxID=280293 RepID=UPI0018924BA1|nr:hypothetical protein [Catenulispora rubra]